MAARDWDVCWLFHQFSLKLNLGLINCPVVRGLEWELEGK